MPESKYNSRRAFFIENRDLHVIVLPEGGHIAAIVDKKTGVNPLWTPPWKSVNPVMFDPIRNPEFGVGSDARLLAGIMGHNLCLDIFGGPSPAEEAAGLTAHGEGSVVGFAITEGGDSLTMKARFPLAQTDFSRRISLHGSAVRIEESVTSLASFDRPIGWTQHVTLGPPFLERGVTQFRASAAQSKVFESDFGDHAYLKTGAEFEWPLAPRKDGTYMDLRVMNLAESSSAYTAQAMDPRCEHAFFTAWQPSKQVSFGYVWKTADFPWMGIWEENHSRENTPWNGKTLARAMEFGVSPFPETRREMAARASLFGIPAYRWLPARATLTVEYWAVMQNAAEPVVSLPWPAVG